MKHTKTVAAKTLLLNLNRPIVPKKLEFTGFFGTFFVLLTAY